MATLDTGPPVAVVVCDLSTTGARVTAPAGSGILPAATLALTTYRRRWWRVGRRHALRAMGQVLRVNAAADGLIEAVVRFHTPATVL